MAFRLEMEDGVVPQLFPDKMIPQECYTPEAVGAMIELLVSFRLAAADLSFLSLPASSSCGLPPCGCHNGFLVFIQPAPS